MVRQEQVARGAMLPLPIHTCRHDPGTQRHHCETHSIWCHGEIQPVCGVCSNEREQKWDRNETQADEEPVAEGEQYRGSRSRTGERSPWKPLARAACQPACPDEGREQNHNDSHLPVASTVETKTCSDQPQHATERAPVFDCHWGYVDVWTLFKLHWRFVDLASQ